MVLFSKQEYWSGFPCPSPADLPDPGVKPASPVAPALAYRFFTTEPPRKPSPPTVKHEKKGRGKQQTQTTQETVDHANDNKGNRKESEKLFSLLKVLQGNPDRAQF